MYVPFSIFHIQHYCLAMFFTFQHFNLFGVYYLSSYIFSSLFTIHRFVLLMFFTFFLSTFCPVQHFVCWRFLPSAFFYHRRFLPSAFLPSDFFTSTFSPWIDFTTSRRGLFWLSPLISYGSWNSQAGGWTSKEVTKVLKTKQTQGPSGWSPFRSDVSRDGQAGHCTSWEVAKETQGRVGKTTLESQGT
jgi:hypothetical protein